MPCDTRLLTFSEMLRLATERLAACDKRLTECRVQIEGATTAVQAASECLDRAISDRAKAREAYIDWLSYLGASPDEGSLAIRERSTALFNANAHAAMATLSARETVSRFQKTLDEATAEFASAQDAHTKIAEERNLIVIEIAKLSSMSR